MGNITHHFLGYWGYGVQRELEALLNNVEKLHKTTPINQFSPEENYLHPVWNVGYTGLDGNFLPQQNQIAAISASGLSTSPDAWVSLQENNCLILGREPFGKVPLYWTVQGQVIWFASQLQLLNCKLS